MGDSHLQIEALGGVGRLDQEIVEAERHLYVLLTVDQHLLSEHIPWAFEVTLVVPEAVAPSLQRVTPHELTRQEALLPKVEVLPLLVRGVHLSAYQSIEHLASGLVVVEPLEDDGIVADDVMADGQLSLLQPPDTFLNSAAVVRRPLLGVVVLDDQAVDH